MWKRRLNVFCVNLSASWRRMWRSRSLPTAQRRFGTRIAAIVLVIGVACCAAAAVTLDVRSIGWVRQLDGTSAAFFHMVTRWGQSDWMLISTALSTSVLLLADWARVDRRSAAAWAELGMIRFCDLLAIAVSGLLSDLIKWLVGRSRPVLFTEDGAFAFQPFSVGYAHVSFPSGHATNVAAAATTMIIAAPRRIAILAIGAAALIGISRVMVGAHYPSDVIAGAALGTVTTLGLAYALSRARFAFMPGEGGWLRPRTTALRQARSGRAIFLPLLVALGVRAPAGRGA